MHVFPLGHGSATPPPGRYKCFRFFSVWIALEPPSVPSVPPLSPPPSLLSLPNHLHLIAPPPPLCLSPVNFPSSFVHSTIHSEHMAVRPARFVFQCRRLVPPPPEKAHFIPICVFEFEVKWRDEKDGELNSSLFGLSIGMRLRTIPLRERSIRIDPHVFPPLSPILYLVGTRD